MSYESGVGGLQQGIGSVSPSDAIASVQPNQINTAAKADGQVKGEVEHADQTSLSSAGELVAGALGTSDVQTAKVASLQQAISTGHYHISASDVADKLVQTLLGP